MGDRARPAVTSPRWFGALSAVDALLGLLALALALVLAGWLLYVVFLSVGEVLTPSEEGMAHHDRAMQILTVLAWSAAGTGILMLLVDLPVLVLSALRARAWGLTALVSLVAVLTGSLLPLLLGGVTWAASTLENESLWMSLGLLLLGVGLVIVPTVRLAQLVVGILAMVRRAEPPAVASLP